MLKPAQQYLTLRSLGAPAVLLSLAMQGVFRGFKDTKTPLYAIGMQHIVATFPFISPLGTLVQCVLNSCISVSLMHQPRLLERFTHPIMNSCHILSNIVAGDLTNIILDPIFIFYFRLGVSGAAIAHVISQ